MNNFLLTLLIFLLNISSALAVSNTTGLFKFTQYVTLEKNEKEVKAVEGLIYISESVFSEQEKKEILNKKLIFDGTSKARMFHRDYFKSVIRFC